MKTKETMMMKMRKGATFIEYALLAGLVAIVVASAALMFGDKIKALFSKTSTQTEQVTKSIGEVNLTAHPEQTGGGSGGN